MVTSIDIANLNIIDERKLMKTALKCALVEKMKWQPIDIKWIEKWKSFVKFDDDEETGVGMVYDDDIAKDDFPGPIDNSQLKGRFEGELKPGATEGTDFILLPNDTCQILYRKYGNAGTEFIRPVINVGGKMGHVILQVSIHRVRIEAYMCNKATPSPQQDDQKFKIVHVAKNETFESMIEIVKNEFKKDSLLSISSLRCWIKDDQRSGSISPRLVHLKDKQEGETQDTSSPLLSISSTPAESLVRSGEIVPLGSSPAPAGNTTDNNSPSGSKRARVGRLLTSDVTNRDGQWIYENREDVNSRLVADVLASRECLEVILETTTNKNPLDLDWPRAEFLHQWKNSLREGDLIDAMDRDKKWCTASVLKVHATGDVMVHFKGWSSTFDETIPTEKKITHVQPLYSHSYDRNRWEDGSKVEIKLSGTANSGVTEKEKIVWWVVSVCAVDLVSERVQVQFSISEKIKTLQEHGISIPPSIATTSSGDVDGSSSLSLMSSTGIPKSPSWTDSLSNFGLGSCMNSSNSVMTDDDIKKSKENDQVKQWFDIMGEDITPLYTHTKKEADPAQTARPSYYKASNSWRASATGITSSALTLYSGKSKSTPSDESITVSSLFNDNDNDAPAGDCYFDKHTRGKPLIAGAVGLQNLGNTCFMNSILQCLSNTQGITEELTSDNHRAQLNYDNPLGHGGKVALAYAKLIKDLWSGAYTKVLPREFKTTIGMFQPQFAGYEQQDSQEFMGFLLDGLHEDLNRINKKPAVTKIESKGRDDELISAESWRRYLLRNDSMIVDKCFGQLRSHVTCTSCGKESVTFDEYSSLSVPIPVKRTWSLLLLVQLLPGQDGVAPPLKLQLEVSVADTMSSLQGMLAKKLVEAGAMVLPTTGEGTEEHSSNNAGIKSDGSNSLSSSGGNNNGSDGSDSSGSKRDCNIPAQSSSDEEGKRWELVAADNETQITDEFEMVEHEDTKPGGGDCDDDKKQPQQQQQQGSMGLEKTTTSSDPYASVKFQFGLLKSMKPNTVNKNYDPERCRADLTVQGFVNKNETFQMIAFQTPNENIPVPKEPSGYTAYSSYSRGMTSSSSNEAATVEPKYFTIDFCMGCRTPAYTAGTDKADLFGHPYRHAFPVDATNRDIHDVAKKIALRFVKEGSPHHSVLLGVHKDTNSGSACVAEAEGMMAIDTASEKTETETETETETSSVDGNLIEDAVGGAGQDVVISREDRAGQLEEGEVVEEESRSQAPRSYKEAIQREQKAAEGEKLPYDVTTVAQWNFNVTNTVHHTDDIFDTSTVTQNMLVILWHKDVYSKPQSANTYPYRSSTYSGNWTGTGTGTGSNSLVTSIYDENKSSAKEESLDSSEKDSNGDSFDEDEVDKVNLRYMESQAKLESKKISIYDCLDKFIEREKLADAETLYCSNCKNHLAPIKKMDMYSTPDILVVHLKRFQYINGQYFMHREKINELVDFPVSGLDLTSYVRGPQPADAPPVYDLYAVSQHMGGLGGGHYTAVCKNFRDDKWYNFNDSSVTPESNPAFAVCGSAYVLFYQRRTGAAKWGGVVPSPVAISDED